MAQSFERIPKNTDTLSIFIGKNSEVFATADPVIVDSSGWLDVMTTPGTTTRVIGWKVGNETMASDNQTSAKVKPSIIMANMGVQLRFPSDVDCEQLHIGGWNHFTSSSTTGSFTVDLTALTKGTDGAVCILQRDPEFISDNDVVVVCAAEPQQLFSQA